MGQKEEYRKQARIEISVWIDPKRDGDLCDKFWYVDCARRDSSGAWHVVLGEEKIFYSATRLSEPDILAEEQNKDDEVDTESFDDLGLWCEAVLDEVKRAIQEYLHSSDLGYVRDWGVSVGEETYRILSGPRLEGWRYDPRRFIAEYTLIEARMRDSTEIWSQDE